MGEKRFWNLLVISVSIIVTVMMTTWFSPAADNSSNTQFMPSPSVSTTLYAGNRTGYVTSTPYNIAHTEGDQS